MNLKQRVFGTYAGKKITQYILENDHRMQVKIMDLGATITSITIPDKDGKPVSLSCGFDKLEDYFSEEYTKNAPYFGSTIGRYCSQIKDAQFPLNGHTYTLTPNGGKNNLHGGKKGFDKKLWKGKKIQSPNGVGVLFTTLSPDMEEGFPGNVNVSVSITLTNDNEIVLEYHAKTDKSTPFSMTNHTYFNLSGFKHSVEDFTVKLNTHQLLELDNTGAATGKIKDVAETIEDLREGRRIREVQQTIKDGFEHFYIFNNPQQNLNSIAEIDDPESGRKLKVSSTEPCMLFYTAKYMSNKLQRNPAEAYGKQMGFACETHRWPNGPNIAEAPGTILNPEKPFYAKTIFKIYW